MNTDLRGPRWDMTVPEGASVGPLVCMYEAGLVGASVRVSVYTSRGERLSGSVTIVDALDGEFEVHITPSTTRTAGVGTHTWACEIEAGGAVVQGWQGRFVVTKEVAA